MVETAADQRERRPGVTVFQLAQHIDSDQRVEIARMKALLAELDS